MGWLHSSGVGWAIQRLSGWEEHSYLKFDSLIQMGRRAIAVVKAWYGDLPSSLVLSHEGKLPSLLWLQGWAPWQLYNFVRHIFPCDTGTSDNKVPAPICAWHWGHSIDSTPRFICLLIIQGDPSLEAHLLSPLITWVTSQVVIWTDWNTYSCAGRWYVVCVHFTWPESFPAGERRETPKSGSK